MKRCILDSVQFRTSKYSWAKRVKIHSPTTMELTLVSNLFLRNLATPTALILVPRAFKL